VTVAGERFALDYLVVITRVNCESNPVGAIYAIMRWKNLAVYTLGLGLLLSGGCGRLGRLIEISHDLKYGLKDYYTEEERKTHLREARSNLSRFGMLIEKHEKTRKVD